MVVFEFVCFSYASVLLVYGLRCCGLLLVLFCFVADCALCFSWVVDLGLLLWVLCL